MRKLKVQISNCKSYLEFQDFELIYGPGLDKCKDCLLVRNGEVLSIETQQDCHDALYDVHQCCDGLEDGDEIEVVPHGWKFWVTGVHVVKV